MIEVNDANFQEEIINSKIPVIADFYAVWCGPCSRISPILEDIERENKGKVKLAKINVDIAQDTSAKYGIMSIPTVIFFKNGVEVSRSIGAVGKEILNQHLKKLIEE